MLCFFVRPWWDDAFRELHSPERKGHSSGNLLFKVHEKVGLGVGVRKIDKTVHIMDIINLQKKSDY